MKSGVDEVVEWVLARWIDRVAERRVGVVHGLATRSCGRRNGVARQMSAPPSSSTPPRLVDMLETVLGGLLLEA